MQALYPDGIGIQRCWFSWREENQSTWRKTLGAWWEPTNFPINGIGPESNPDHIVEGRAVITGRSLLAKISLTLQNVSQVPMNYLCIVLLQQFFLIGNGHSLNRKTTKQPTHLPIHRLKWLETDVMGSYLSKIFSIGWENLHGQIKN